MIARRHTLVSALFVAALVAACSNSSVGPPSGSAPTSANPTRPVQVGRLSSPNPGSVNVFWMPGPRGFVVIDTGRNMTGGRRVVEEIRRTGQPVVAVLITHPHPDHVGGMGPLREAYPQAPIYASEATVKYMRTDPLMFYQLARRDDTDYPVKISYPDHTLGPDASLELGGTRWEVAQFGPGESEAATVYYEPITGALFSGDLTSNHATPALLEGHTCGWLTNLDQLRDRFPHARTIYPGHGDPGEPSEQIQAQQTYLQTFRSLVRPAVSASSPDGTMVSVDERTSIIAELERRYPGYPRVAALPTLQEANVAGVARELTAENPASLPLVCR
ncbi:MAG: MBL fold metallo-hydrolase [Pseudonocardiaceae bacterium]